MKKTIQGLRYNTEKATRIGRFCNGKDRSDFEYWDASLYVTLRNAHYFIAGEGGPMTRFGVALKHSIEWDGTPGERLEPISKDNAYRWAKIYLELEDVEKYFADMDK